MSASRHAYADMGLLQARKAVSSRSMLSSGAPSVYISASSLYEIALNGQYGKWPEVGDIWNMDMFSLFQSHGTKVIPANRPIMQRAGAMDWAHRDPFDHIIAVTAMTEGLPLVSKGKSFDELGEKALQRIW